MMRVVLAVSAVVLGACASVAAAPAATSAAAATCARVTGDATIPADPKTARLAGAFTLTAAELATQDETPRGGPTGPHPLRSSYRDYPANTPIVLCYFDGFIAASHPAPIAPATPYVYDRYVVSVDPSGNARLAVAGRHETLPVAPRLP